MKKMKTAWWIGLAALTMLAVPAQAEETTDIEELFYTYSSDNLVFSYSEPAYVLPDDTYRGVLQYQTFQGFLSLDQLDLDWDGEEELLAIRVKQPEGTQQNDLVAEVYQYQGDKLQRIAQTTIAEDILLYDQANIDVFLVDTDYGIYLCCEDTELAGMLANGYDWNLRMYTYSGGAFTEQLNTGIIGSDWEESEEAEAQSTLNGIGLYPAELVYENVADQVGNLTMLNDIDRGHLLDYEEINSFLTSPTADSLEYGVTSFYSYLNADRENKIPGTFASAAQRTSSLSDDYVIADSDSRYITEEDLAGLTDYEILLARNEIYARRGRIFNNEELNTYFRSKSWYSPTVSGEDFTEEYAASVFNDYELQNIAAIVAYEKAHDINQAG